MRQPVWPSPAVMRILREDEDLPRARRLGLAVASALEGHLDVETDGPTVFTHDLFQGRSVKNVRRSRVRGMCAPPGGGDG